MMENQMLITSISTLISLIGIWILAMWFGRDYHIANYRQSMFELRAELFDMAADGEISFDHPAYNLLRNTMNGMIRYGHRVTLFNGLLLMLFLHKHRPWKLSFSQRWNESLKELSPKKIQRLRQLKENMDVLVVKQLLLGSPLLLMLIIPSFVAHLSMSFCKGALMRLFSRQIESMDTVALSVVEN